MSKSREVLFYRDFRRFSGGHLKVWDYFSHVSHSQHCIPRIHFSEQTCWDGANPWLDLRDRAVQDWQPEQADILFLAGLDWRVFSEAQRQSSSAPRINLIQHVRHAWAEDERYPFLKYRAIRICVSQEVMDAIQGTGVVNGPLFAIPNGIDFSLLPTSLDRSERDTDMLIAGIKQPKLAGMLQKELSHLGKRIDVLLTPLPRADFLERLSHAKAALFLPDETEGFYLPALEGMMLETVVVCPDCIGNRSFCLPGYNCFRPQYTFQDLLEATAAALALPPAHRERMLTSARRTAMEHDILRERQAFLDILDNVNQLM